MIRIVIADDHLLFRSMLEEILKRDPQLEVIGTCADGEEVLANYKVWDPDLILLDIGMPKRGGIETLKTIKEKTPQIKVV
ncbi:MAG TPA: response regulator transcription factor, partial [Lachnospiraceae bacterium]|nr:response regulator transcription factor [Lachnospiraceae bacterium]